MTSWISTPVTPPGMPVARSTRVSAGDDLPPRPVIPGRPGRVGLPGQRGVGGDTLRNGEQRGQVSHGVRGRTQAHGPLRNGPCGPFRDRGRIPPVRGGTDRGDDGLVSQAVQRPGVGGEFLIHPGPVPGRQADGVLHDQRHPPLVQCPGPERGEGARHPRQSPGQSQQPGATVRRLPPRQRDLRCDAGSLLLHRHPGLGLLPPLRQIKSHARLSLPGTGHALQVLQPQDLIDLPGIIAGHRNTSQKLNDITNGRYSGRREWSAINRGGPGTPHRPQPCNPPQNRFHHQSLPPGTDNPSHPKPLCGKRETPTTVTPSLSCRCSPPAKQKLAGTSTPPTGETATPPRQPKPSSLRI